MNLEIGDPAAEITSVPQAIDLLTSDKALKGIRSDKRPTAGDTDFGLWFRGHSNASHALVPSILRHSFGQTKRYIDEVSLVRHFRAMNCDAVASDASDFQVLVTMQHYQAPTRLLDWTENLLVALHFAVRDPKNDRHDAAVWMLNARRLNYYTSVSSRKSEVLFENELDVVARSSLIRVRKRKEWLDVLRRSLRAKAIDKEEYRIRRVINLIRDVKLFREQVNDSPASDIDVRKIKVLDDAGRGEKDLKRDWATPEILDVRVRSPVAVYPNRANRRIRAQSGCFTLHGGKFVSDPHTYLKDKQYAEPIGLPISLHEIERSLKLKRKILRWFLIPAGSQGKIRQTLARIGVTDATLFPELEYQSRYLHERWTTRRVEPEEE